MLKLQITDRKLEEDLLSIAKNFDNNLEKTLRFFLTSFKKEYKKDKAKKFNASKFRGIYENLDVDLDREITELRNEWERNI